MRGETRSRTVRAAAVAMVLIFGVASCGFLDDLKDAIQELIAGGISFDSGGNLSVGGIDVLTGGRTAQVWQAKDDAANATIAAVTDDNIATFLNNRTDSPLGTVLIGDNTGDDNVSTTLSDDLRPMGAGTDPSVFTAEGNGDITIRLQGGAPDLDASFDKGVGKIKVDDTGLDPTKKEFNPLSPGLGIGVNNRPLIEKYYRSSLPPNKTATGTVPFSTFIAAALPAKPDTVYPFRKIGVKVTRSVVNGVVQDEPVLTLDVPPLTTLADPLKAYTLGDLATDITVVGPVSTFKKDSQGNWRGGQVTVVASSPVKLFGADVSKTFTLAVTVAKNGDIYFQADAPFVVELSPKGNPTTLPGKVIDWFQRWFRR